MKFCMFLLCCFGVLAVQGQETSPRASLGVSYSVLRFQPGEQYFGAGIEVRYMVRPWVGIQAQIEKFPQTNQGENAVSGGSILLGDGDIVIGHRWKRAGLFAEAGVGRFHTGIFKGFNQQVGFVFTTRDYADLQSGILLEIWLGRRWSVTFEGRDNMEFIGAYAGIGINGPTNGPSGPVNAPEGRSGVAFHFW